MQSILNQSNFLKIYQKSSTLSKREAFQEISGSALKNVIPKMQTTYVSKKLHFMPSLGNLFFGDELKSP